MMVGLASYTNGTKQTWRGWCWNRVAERLTDIRKPRRDRLRDKTVLYLVGPDDFDRKTALNHGFRNENLIAVDTSQDNIDAVRKAGGVGICDDLVNVLVAWSPTKRIDAVVADTCSTLSARSLDILAAICSCRGVHRGTVVAFNLQRGRDRESKDFRECLLDNGMPLELVKNRASCLCSLLVIRILEDFKTLRPSGSCSDAYRVICDGMNSIGMSYRNPGGVYMDSCVFSFPWGNTTDKRDSWTRFSQAREWLTLYGGMTTTPKTTESAVEATKRRVAALQAIRTKAGK